jgi:hypothetical protein
VLVAAVDFGPNTITGSILAQTVYANNAATQFTYSPAYENYVLPASFTTPAATFPSVIARGSWLQCRTADNLTDPCDRGAGPAGDRGRRPRVR